MVSVLPNEVDGDDGDSRTECGGGVVSVPRLERPEETQGICVLQGLTVPQETGHRRGGPYKKEILDE